jgi:archaellum biogenesis protein FlaJ (TadC family)
MREYNDAELELMAKAYERAYERNSESLESLKTENPSLVSSVVESLVSGIVEVIDQGERNEEFLVSAALSKINSLLARSTS